jgi:GAF domain-containing protein
VRRTGWLRRGGWLVAAATGSLLAAGTTMIVLYQAEHPGVLPGHVVVPLFYNIPLALAFAVVAAAILRRLPGHPIGWLFGLVGFATAMSLFAEGYAAWSPPGVSWVLWLWTLLNGPIFFALAMALLVFPTGTPPSRRWRPLAAVLWLYLGTAVLVPAVAPGPPDADFLVLAVAENRGWPGGNPLGWDRQPWLADAAAAVVPVGVGLLLGSLASLLPRWRRAVGDERQQIKWLGLAALLASLEILAGLVQSLAGQMPAGDPTGELVGNAVFVLVVIGIPVAIGLGIVRYRLYDIDAIISRTLGYGGLAGFIGLAYLAGVVVAGELAGRWAGSSTLLALVATAVVAAVFQPVRSRLRAGADRLVFGRRAAPYELMTRFGHQLGQALAPPELLARMAEAAGQAARARTARVTAHLPDGQLLTAHWPAAPQPGPPVPSRSALVVPVRHEGATIAEIAVAGTEARAADVALLRHIAAVSAGALHNLRLLAELESLHAMIQLQNEEITASQRRLVAAAREERDRLERLVGHRIGPDLDALRQSLPGLRDAVPREPERVVAGCERLAVRADRIVDELRALSRGILPPLLVDHGLAAAVRALLRRVGGDVALQVVPPVDRARFPAPVETTAYLCCRAAVEAAGRPADRVPERTELRLWADQRGLRFSVTTAPGRPEGDELAALRDRVITLGGELEFASAGGSATLTGRVPVEPGLVRVDNPR